MTAHKGLVLDANILLRAIFGQRVRQILEAYEDQANFYAPDACFQDANGQEIRVMACLTLLVPLPLFSTVCQHCSHISVYPICANM